MTTIKNLTQPIHRFSLAKLMIVGAAIGFLAISFFVFGVDHPKPEWGNYWMVRPLIITPLAGAMTGAFYYLMDYLRYQGGWKKIVANVLSFFALFIGLWLGIVLGLVGTMWD